MPEKALYFVAHPRHTVTEPTCLRCKLSPCRCALNELEERRAMLERIHRAVMREMTPLASAIRRECKRTGYQSVWVR